MNMKNKIIIIIIPFLIILLIGVIFQGSIFIINIKNAQTKENFKKEIILSFTENKEKFMKSLNELLDYKDIHFYKNLSKIEIVYFDESGQKHRMLLEEKQKDFLNIKSLFDNTKIKKISKYNESVIFVFENDMISFSQNIVYTKNINDYLYYQYDIIKYDNIFDNWYFVEK